MGFGVSGSFALLAVGTVLALGGIYATTANTVERVGDARQAEQSRLHGLQETAIDLVSLDASGPCGVVLNVTNAGDRRLSLNRTDLLVNGAYHLGWRDGAEIDGDAGTALWLPGENLTVNVTSGLDAGPDRFKIVTEGGVAQTGTVTGGSSC